MLPTTPPLGLRHLCSNRWPELEQQIAAVLSPQCHARFVAFVDLLQRHGALAVVRTRWPDLEQQSRPAARYSVFLEAETTPTGEPRDSINVSSIRLCFEEFRDIFATASAAVTRRSAFCPPKQKAAAFWWEYQHTDRPSSPSTAPSKPGKTAVKSKSPDCVSLHG